RAKRLVGADIRRGFLATNVLLACGKSEHKTAPALRVGCLPSKPSWHLAYESFARSNYASERPAIAWRQAEALALHGHDVRFRGRPNQAERDALGHRHDEHCARSVRGFCERCMGFDHAEEVW